MHNYSLITLNYYLLWFNILEDVYKLFFYFIHPRVKKKKSFKYVMLKLSSEILESLPKRFTKIKQVIFNY